MLHVDDHGRVAHPKVRLAISLHIERGPMTHVQGIIVHQTGSPTARSTLNGYGVARANGAHFLIDKDGTIYQTASVLKQTAHVGSLRSRCIATRMCSRTETQALLRMGARERNRHEMGKQVPDRYPSNEDSIGIEIVGQAFPLNETRSERQTYEAVTTEQNASLKWLVQALATTLGVPMTEVFRHPVVSQKNMSEAATATW
jgi:N-acetyl-anhydromuramyl-L-alanine amidase AmpD